MRYDTNSELVFFDRKTYLEVTKNIVLRDVINYVGRCTYIDKTRPLSILRLLYIYIIGFFKVKYIHFGILNEGILSKLWKVHARKVFFCQQDSYRHDHLIYREKLTGKKFSLNIKPFYGNLIAFNDLMPQLSVVNDSTKVFHFGETRTRANWINFTREKSEFYFNKYHANLKLDDNFIVFILGPMCEVIWLKERDSFEKLFHKTMEVLRENFTNTKVLLKPHATTDMNIVNNELKKGGQFELTYLHPSVLAHHANCFISNLYSTTFADAYNLGVETVEYTDYNEKVLLYTSGKSVSYEYVDYFINNDSEKLIYSLNDILAKQNKKNIKDQSRDDDKSGLLNELAH
jgi:hypothetical protein